MAKKKQVQLPQPSPSKWPDVIWMAVIFGLTCKVYLDAPQTQVTDSNYTILQTEQLLSRHTWMLDDVFLPNGVDDVQRKKHPPLSYQGDVPGLPYHIQVLPGKPDGARLTHWYPPGSMLLSLPLVAIGHWYGITAKTPNGQPDIVGEEAAQAIYAAIVTALFAAFAFLLARVYVSGALAALIAVSTALSTMALSTSSRAMWSSTWGIALLAAALWLLARQEQRREAQSPEPQWYLPVLATLLSWTWFCRPSFATPIAAVGVYILWRNRRAGLLLGLYGAVWFAGFIVFSLSVYGTALPSYYRHGEFTTSTLWLSFSANLLSPSRGVLIYAPTSLLIFWTLWHFRQHLPSRALAVTAIGACLSHLALIVPYPTWWAGHSYGARFFVEWLPWLVLLAAQGIAAAQKQWHLSNNPQLLRTGRRNFGLLLTAFAVLSVAGVLINARGAYARAAFRWNSEPINTNTQAARAVWNWRYPQFLAGLIDWPDPHPAPPLALGKWQKMGENSGDAPLLLEGWGDTEPGFRWTCEPHARLAFHVDQPRALQLSLVGDMFSPNSRLEQRLIVSVNGVPVGQQTLHDPMQHTLVFQVPAEIVQKDNTLRLELPDARSPLEMGISKDWRKLGFALRRFEVR